ncbi:MAG: glycosyltransferase [Phycisphaeraceae bacterium]|nr:glycosyltransferase [Phycisphaeraceae bacterium]
MESRRFSVVLSTLDQACFLEQTLCSILDQASGAQVIVVDRGSKDHTQDILSFYRRGIDRVLLRPGDSQAQSINAALPYIRGDVTTILDGDDLLMPGAWEEVGRTIGGADQPGWMAVDLLSVDSHDQVRRRVSSEAPSSLAAMLMREEDAWLPDIGMFWRTDLARRFGPLREDLQHAHLFEWWCRWMAEGEQPAIVHRALVAQRELALSLAPQRVLDENLEQIRVGELLLSHVARTQRQMLRVNLDRRRRILALARAEADGYEGHLFLLCQVLLRPWWLTDQHLRHALMQHLGPHHLPLAA